MSLETEVAALTTATTNLLTAVNISKGVLDAGVLEATTAAASIGGANKQTLSGNLTLTALSPAYQMLNPDGANRDVTLEVPTLGGRAYSVKNIGTANFLTVKNAGGTQLGPVIGAGYALTVVWSGTEWQVIA